MAMMPARTWELDLYSTALRMELLGSRLQGAWIYFNEIYISEGMLIIYISIPLKVHIQQVCPLQKRDM